MASVPAPQTADTTMHSFDVAPTADMHQYGIPLQFTPKNSNAKCYRQYAIHYMAREVPTFWTAEVHMRCVQRPGIQCFFLLDVSDACSGVGIV